MRVQCVRLCGSVRVCVYMHESLRFSDVGKLLPHVCERGTISGYGACDGIMAAPGMHGSARTSPCVRAMRVCMCLKEREKERERCCTCTDVTHENAFYGCWKDICPDMQVFVSSWQLLVCEREVHCTCARVLWFFCTCTGVTRKHDFFSRCLVD
jgi:hypothetical protein